MADEVARVAQRLNEAKETNKLDLSKCELKQIPEAAYFVLKDAPIESCNLSGNNLKRIQAKFVSKLPSLKELQVQDNQLSALPDEFQQFGELQFLDISRNKFENLPAFIFDSQKITTVIATANKIQEIDIEQLRRMPCLKELNLQDNPLTAETEEKLKQLDSCTVYTGLSDPLSTQLDDVE